MEACKHSKQIIHGCNIAVHTNHKNLIFNTAQGSNAHVERSLILLQEEFGVKLKHIPGEENTGADGLSRLALDKNLVINNTILATQTIDEGDSYMFPLDMHVTLDRSNSQTNHFHKSSRTQSSQNTLDGCNSTSRCCLQCHHRSQTHHHPLPKKEASNTVTAPPPAYQW
jgi:hypothetical protein